MTKAYKELIEARHVNNFFYEIHDGHGKRLALVEYKQGQSHADDTMDLAARRMANLCGVSLAEMRAEIARRRANGEI